MGAVESRLSLKKTMYMWNVNMYSVVFSIDPFYLHTSNVTVVSNDPNNCSRTTMAQSSVHVTDHCDVYSYDVQHPLFLFSATPRDLVCFYYLFQLFKIIIGYFRHCSQLMCLPFLRPH